MKAYYLNTTETTSRLWDVQSGVSEKHAASILMVEAWSIQQAQLYLPVDFHRITHGTVKLFLNLTN
jgi:hypothetical protein